MKKTLTAEEIALMKQVRDEWIARFNSLEFDEAKARDLINYLYSLANLPAPKIIFMDSPLGLQYAANLFEEASVRDSVGASVWASVRDSVWDSVRASVWDSVRDSVWDSVRASVRDSVWASVWASVRDSVRASVWASVRAGKLHFFSFGESGDIYDFGWVSFYDFFERIGIKVPEKFLEYRKLISANIFLTLQFKKLCIVSRPPTFLQCDERGRMHCISDYAIAFADGYGQHYVHGVFFEPDLFKQIFIKKSLSKKNILGLKNAEQKAAVIQVFGYDTFLEELNAKVLDEKVVISQVTSKPVKCQVFEFGLNNAVLRFVRLEDHSVHKVTCLGVPRSTQTETVEGARAWTFGLEEKEFKPEVET